jgi:hypothetical protein
MHSSISKDESTLHLNKEEAQYKKRVTLNNAANDFKASGISHYSLKMSKSITRFNLKNSLGPDKNNNKLKIISIRINLEYKEIKRKK